MKVQGACLEAGANAPAPPRDAVGLYHVAPKIGDSLDELRAAIWAADPAAVAQVKPLALG